MVRTTVCLSNELHNKLKHLASELQCSMADLLRTAAEEVYWENLEDIQLAKSAWEEHGKAPHRAIPAREFFSYESSD